VYHCSEKSKLNCCPKKNSRLLESGRQTSRKCHNILENSRRIWAKNRHEQTLASSQLLTTEILLTVIFDSGHYLLIIDILTGCSRHLCSLLENSKLTGDTPGPFRIFIPFTWKLIGQISPRMADQRSLHTTGSGTMHNRILITRHVTPRYAIPVYAVRSTANSHLLSQSDQYAKTLNDFWSFWFWFACLYLVHLVHST